MPLKTFDQATISAAGAFVVGELERLDQTLHAPLAEVSWGRDIDLRSDVTLADEISSFTNTTFGTVGGVNSTGKNFISGKSSEIASIAADIKKSSSAMHLWALGLDYTVIELARSQQLGRALDRVQHEGLVLKHNMDVDEMVYVGDESLGAYGLCNNPNIETENSSLDWATATPRQILDDVNNIFEKAWEQTAYSLMPDRLLLPTKNFARLTQPVTDAGSKSILQYIKEECLSFATNGREPEIFPLKWLNKQGVGDTGRAVAYIKGQRYVRFPMVPLQHTPVEQRGLSFMTIYFGTLGQVEFVYPETVAYMDGI